MIDAPEGRDSAIRNCVTEIVAAYVSNNHVARGDLPALIVSISASLAGLKAQPSQGVPEPTTTPAQIRRSITPDALISFLDGRPYKVLRRHLSVHGLTPASYCERFGLPADYPMVAPSYSERRSTLAHSLGLGLQRRGRVKNDV